MQSSGEGKTSKGARAKRAGPISHKTTKNKLLLVPKLLQIRQMIECATTYAWRFMSTGHAEDVP
jgi:hypothetical protein